MYRASRVAGILTITMLLCVASTGVANANTDAEAAALAGFRAAADGDWDAVAKRMHPDAQREFKDLMWPILSKIAAKDTLGAASMFLGVFAVEATDGELVEKTPEQFCIDAINGMLATFEIDINVQHAEAIGSVPEGDSLIHVVVRVTVGVENPDEEALETISVTDMDVITMKEYEGAWRSVLNSDYRSMIREMSHVVDQMLPDDPPAGE